MSCLPAINPLAPEASVPVSTIVRRGGAILLALFVLTKPRLAFFSLLTAMAAYGATQEGATAAHTMATLCGTALAAGGALSLNQWWERRTDALMRRTRGRPLPSEAIPATVALAWSLMLSIGGVGLLALRVNLSAAALAMATIVIYGVIYTPLKRRTRWATEIGSISGALPPLLGAAAGGEVLSESGVLLAAVLLLWQMPHFFAIGWLYREDYRTAGFPLLPAIDDTGARTAGWSVGYTVLLLLISVALGAINQAGWFYLLVAGGAGGWMLWRALQFAREGADRDRAARKLFFASIVYLPLVMAALCVGALWG